MTHFTEHSTPKPRAVKPLRRSLVLIFLGGPIFGWLGMLAANGNGWSPLIFFGFGFVATLMSEWCFGIRKRNRGLLRLVALLCISFISFFLAIYSARADTHAAFLSVLHTLPDASVTNIRGWTQWYDGRDTLVAFNASPEFVKNAGAVSGLTPLKLNPFSKPESGGDPMRRLRMLMGALPFFDTDRLRLNPMIDPVARSVENSTAPGSTQRRILIWDEKSGQGVLYLGED